jgi:hypothetical protein
MKALARRMFTGFALPCAILCVAAIALWVRSYWFIDDWDWNHQRYSQTSLGCARGHLFLAHATISSLAADSHQVYFLRGPGYHRTPFTAGGDTSNVLAPRWHGAGFSFASTSFYAFGFWEARIPLWFVTLITAIPPATWAWRYRKGRAPPRGFDVQLTHDAQAR